MAAATLQARLRDEDPEGMPKKLYDRRLSFHQYQFDSAVLRSAMEMRSRISTSVWTLFEDLRGCDSIDEVLGVIRREEGAEDRWSR